MRNRKTIDIEAAKPAPPAVCPVEQPVKEVTEKPTVTVKIEGMMCGHCERTIQTALEALPFIASAQANHEAGTAVVTLTAPLDETAVKKAVEDKDYEFIGIITN